MVDELVAAKACDMIRGRWAGMRDAERPTVTGTLWIRGCDAVRTPADTWQFSIHGDGWQWHDVTRKLGSGSYVVREVERFDATTRLNGWLEVLYDQSSRTATVWFHHVEPPHVMVTATRAAIGQPVEPGKLDDAVLGAIFGAFARRQVPERYQNTIELRSLDVVATVPLCVGIWSVGVGHGASAPVTEETPAPVDLGPSELAMHGPFAATRSMTLAIESDEGAPRVSLMCETDAEALANAYLAGSPLPHPKLLATTVVHGQTQLQATWPRCPVVMVARSSDERPARFTWSRPIAETQLIMEPPVDCPATTRSPPTMGPPPAR